MVTRAHDNQAPTQTTQLCDFCHQKPRFPPHQFCGKTCAAKAVQALATLCRNCHKKPRYQNYDCCGRTCARALASSKKSGGTTQVPNATQGPNPNTLCDHCHKKPKFQKYSYCGKTCASLASAQRNNKSHHSNQTVGDDVQVATNTYVLDNTTGAVDHTTTLRLPQCVLEVPGPQVVSASLTDINTNTNTYYTTNPNYNSYTTSSYIPIQTQAQVAPPSNNPFLNAPTTYDSRQGQLVPTAITKDDIKTNTSNRTNTSTKSTKINNSTTRTTSASTTQPTSTNIFKSFAGKLLGKPKLQVDTGITRGTGGCIIVGCKKPGRFDSQFGDSDFCTMGHRELAVTSNLLSPCIMCLVLPQSDNDYFCSNDCRHDSMNKRFDDEEYDDDDEEEEEEEDDAAYGDPEWNGQ